MDLTTLALAFFIGLLGGVLSGMFGMGGATIKIPLMHLLLGMNAHAVIGTALPLTIPAALTGAIVYRKNKLLKYKTILVCGIAGAAASVIGAMFTEYFSSMALMAMLGVLLIFLAYITPKQGWIEREAWVFSDKEKLARTVFIGIVAGMCAGFFGIGGGIVLVPLLMRLRRIPYREAVASSLAIMVIYSVPAAATHFALGNVNMPILGAMFLGAIWGAWFGANKVVSAKGTDMKNRLAALLAILGIILILYEGLLFYRVLLPPGTSSCI
ncbi:MAG: sulfite exporter TauE/SafE family protein [Candidatus Bilamarchaeaceae archaeon]